MAAIRKPSKILDHLFLGDAMHGTDEKMLCTLEIYNIVCISKTNHGKNLPATKFKVLHISIEDMPDEDILNRLESTNTFIGTCVSKSQPVLVHCEMGISRSASFILAYLMYSKKMTLKQAVKHAKSARPVVSPNNGFMRQLCQYETQLFGKQSVDITLFKDDWGCGVMFME